MTSNFQTLDPKGDLTLNIAFPEEEIKLVSFLASSRHLSVASPYFDRMFSGPWKESESVKSGSLDVSALPSCGPTSYSIILNAMHGRFRKVPKSLPKAELLQVGKLVDYYECLEVIEYQAERWVDDAFKCDEPALEGGEMSAEWLFLSWIFPNSAIFGLVSKNWVRKAENAVDPGEYPTPQVVTDAIDQRRKKIVSKVIERFEMAFDRLASDQFDSQFPRPSFCRPEICPTLDCRLHMLGQLARQLTELRVLPTFRGHVEGSFTSREQGYEGISYDGLFKITNEFTKPSMCKRSTHYNGYGNTCDTIDFLKGIFSESSTKLSSLNLQALQSVNQRKTNSTNGKA
ncbi:hypothetical protein P152DRAFT_513462 [Eremomyces bilateralis CBS 781.70]|uniref:BTB domain-containing protein n=1 Tax=Eremomyces bilateralis CBS 781.70 TaxID=1392243 RepID=A0A6G1G5G0_9PEZI|nr:uncharacterized protein P152DRAFT_513462 [Eremomyces bilateralis CBS 781.70]KAF1813176.1 hypothetical protein P152DRAFT_513462 [Eremomyces bilateralis CBS 781.70]